RSVTSDCTTMLSLPLRLSRLPTPPLFPYTTLFRSEAASDIDAAWRQLIGNVSDEYTLLAAGKEIPFELRARARRDQVRATGRSIDRKSTRLNSSHVSISYAVFCLKKNRRSHDNKKI